jgi:hypothetical protein
MPVFTSTYLRVDCSRQATVYPPVRNPLFCRYDGDGRSHHSSPPLPNSLSCVSDTLLHLVAKLYCGPVLRLSLCCQPSRWLGGKLCKGGPAAPPSAAVGLDRTCHPTIVRHQEFNGKERLKCTQEPMLLYIGRCVRIKPASRLAGESLAPGVR